MIWDYIAPVLIVGMLFLGLPWIILHYITQWKSAASLTAEDENLLDELHDTARRLDDRLCSIERILTAENPGWRAVACDPVSISIGDRSGERLQDRSPERVRINK